MSKLEIEVPESEIRAKVRYPWVYDCTFRDTLADADMLKAGYLAGMVDIARCEFEAKLEDGTWKHFSVHYKINPLDREMDVMKGFSKALDIAVSKGEISDGNETFKITEVRPLEVPIDQKRLLLKNRIINVLEPQDEKKDEEIIEKILSGGKDGARTR